MMDDEDDGVILLEREQDGVFRVALDPEYVPHAIVGTTVLFLMALWPYAIVAALMGW